MQYRFSEQNETDITGKNILYSCSSSNHVITYLVIQIPYITAENKGYIYKFNLAISPQNLTFYLQ